MFTFHIGLHLPVMFPLFFYRSDLCIIKKNVELLETCLKYKLKCRWMYKAFSKAFFFLLCVIFRTLNARDFSVIW